MSTAGQKLLDLGAKTFSSLTEAEQKLLRATAHGEVTRCGSQNDAENNPQQSDAWETSRTIRADLIRWLCTDREAISCIAPYGIRIDAAKISDRLNLAFVTIPFPVFILRCAIDVVDLSFAEFTTGQILIHFKIDS